MGCSQACTPGLGASPYFAQKTAGGRFYSVTPELLQLLLLSSVPSRFLQVREVPFQAGESVDDRGVELLFDDRHIGHGVADDFRRILDVMERAHPGHLGRKVIGSRRAGFGCFHWRRTIVLAREKWRLEALHLVGALHLFDGLFRSGSYLLYRTLAPFLKRK